MPPPRHRPPQPRDAYDVITDSNAYYMSYPANAFYASGRAILSHLRVRYRVIPNTAQIKMDIDRQYSRRNFASGQAKATSREIYSWPYQIQPVPHKRLDA